MGEIVLDQVTKEFAGGVRAVDDVSLTIREGEFMVLVGPSGCGKTTLLRSIGGLEKISSGRIVIGERDVTRLQPADRDLAMVFQNYALYPHMTVRKNLGYSLRVRKVPKDEANRRIDAVAKLLGLDELLDRRPGQLSGGQQQRVAMGRAIVREPAAFLMDEPLSNLDAKLRVGMRTSLQEMHGRLNTTTVYVTHDQVEAMTLGQRVAVMRNGEVQQVDAPQHLYEHPANVFVGAFIGSPSMNLVRAVIEYDSVRFGELVLPLDPVRRPVGGSREVVLGIRPEAFEDAAFAPPELPRMEVTTQVLEELGSDAHIFFELPGAEAIVVEDAIHEDEHEDHSTLIGRERALFVARVDPRTSAAIGSPVTLAVDPSRLYFFAPESGKTLLAD